MIGFSGDRGTILYLDQLVPTSGNDDWVLWVGGEPHARDPLGVSLIGDGELAVTESVPELDGLVSGTRDNLPVIGGEGDREDVTSVSNESSGGYTSGEFPQSEGLVPRSRESVGTVRRDNTVRDNVSVTVERPLWDTVVLLITGAVKNQTLVNIKNWPCYQIVRRGSYRSQIIRDWSREPDKSIFGFSREVARHCTHPSWSALCSL